MMCIGCEEKDEKIRQLEEELYGLTWMPPADLALTPSQIAIMQTLFAHDRIVSAWLLFDATRMQSNAQGEEVDPSVVRIQISLMRTKLRRFGSVIDTVWSQGYRLTPGFRKRLVNWPEARAAA